MMTSRACRGWGTVGQYLLSTIAPAFQGFVTASCEFRDAHGFAFITGRRISAQPGAGLSRGVHELRLGRPIA